MASDIHGWVERQVNGRWIAISELQGKATHRIYERFAKLAGVRGEGPTPCGVPADASDTVAYHGVQSNGFHSHTWLPLIEAIPIFLETADDLSEFENAHPKHTFFRLDSAEPDHEYRIVLWFDC